MNRVEYPFWAWGELPTRAGRSIYCRECRLREMQMRGKATATLCQEPILDRSAPFR